jgi:hypothetical protein
LARLHDVDFGVIEKILIGCEYYDGFEMLQNESSVHFLIKCRIAVLDYMSSNACQSAQSEGRPLMLPIDSLQSGKRKTRPDGLRCVK